MIKAWPTGYDIARYSADHHLPEADITRDIVRIASIAHLVGAGTLSDDFVLTGGMALRLRGSSRFTIKDTDSSLRGRLDEILWQRISIATRFGWMSALSLRGLASVNHCP